MKTKSNFKMLLDTQKVEFFKAKKGYKEQKMNNCYERTTENILTVLLKKNQLY